MTGKEAKTYKHLPNISAKKQFIIDFWKQRDTTPETEENEVFQGFLYRVAFANRNFAEGGRKGWDTDRGRILIQLGWPNDIYNWRQDLNNHNVEEICIWTYFYPRLELRFVKYRHGMRYKLQINPSLLNSLDYVKKHTYVAEKTEKKTLTFKAKWVKDKLRIRIPTNRVCYVNINKYLVIAKFRYEIFIYTTDNKKWTLRGTITQKVSSRLVLEKKYIEVNIDILDGIKIPAGKHHIDIVISDINSNGVGYREICMMKIKDKR
jgi:GWxTD domain-containing protein